MEREVRVRFAPSPTGGLHIGGVRTALYNYLFARQNGGKFILRIEDTDSQRFVEGAEEYIVESLKWCGIEIDEGVSVGGPHAPYHQSKRSDIYFDYAKQLVDSGWAYYAFDTQQSLEAIRQDYESRGETFAYNYTIRETLQTSLALSADEVERLLSERNDWVIRFKMPENEIIQMADIVRGEISVNSSTLDDKVLFKGIDKLPTYHLANIVDDRLMEISHVIRGEEWLPSLPLHYMLYRAFGWSDEQPEFAHLPLLLKPNGKGKLSKRDGDKLGFPVFPLEWAAPTGELSRGYREDGYLPEAFINFLVLLGWNPGNDQEIMSMDEMISLFNIHKVGKSGSRFDFEKAKWFNAHYLKECDNALLAEQFSEVLTSKSVEVSMDKTLKVVSLIKERATFISDFWSLSDYMFEAPTSYDEKVVKKFWKGDNPTHVAHIADMLAEVTPFDAKEAESRVKGWLKDSELPMGQVMNSLRLSLVGASKGIDVFDIVDVIGVDESILRIKKAVEVL